MAKTSLICSTCGVKHVSTPIASTSPHYNRGKYNDIALVFSCPGQNEKIYNRPVSGMTGFNLCKLLFELKKHTCTKRIFKQYNCIYDFRITNSWSNIEYKGNSPKNRSEANDSEIKCEKNLTRLGNELNDIEKLIICFGKKANLAVKCFAKCRSGKSIKIIHLPHLGAQSVNKICSKKTTPAARAKERMEKIRDCFIAQTKGKKCLSCLNLTCV